MGSRQERCGRTAPRGVTSGEVRENCTEGVTSGVREDCTDGVTSGEVRKDCTEGVTSGEVRDYCTEWVMSARRGAEGLHRGDHVSGGSAGVHWRKHE